MSESFDFEDNFTQTVTETQRIDEGSSDEDRESMKFLLYFISNWFENVYWQCPSKDNRNIKGLAIRIDLK